MVREVITELQSLGLRFTDQNEQRKVGAGPAEGKTILIGGIPISVPFSSPFVSKSPYAVKRQDGNHVLFKYDDDLFKIDLIPNPKFYYYTTNDGIPYLSLIHI